MVPASVVRNIPFNYKWGDLVFARVTASNIYGESDLSEPSKGTKILSVPAPPSIDRQIEITETSLTLGFVDGVHTGGSAVKDYRVSQQDFSGDQDPKVIFESLTAPREFKVEDLVYLNSYLFFVEARNEQGYSQKSKAYQVTFNPGVQPNPP